MRNKYLNAISLAGVVVLLCCSGAPAPEEDPLKVGLVYSLTGPAARWGLRGLRGAMMAQDDINAAGGINGRKLALVVEDSQTRPAVSVSAYEKLTTQAGAAAVIGDLWSVTTNPLIPVADRQKTLLMSPTLVDSSAGFRSPYFFTLGPKTKNMRGAVNDFFARYPAGRSLALFCWEDAWGTALRELVEAAAGERGVEVNTVCNGDYNADYRTDIAAVARRKPDMIFISSLPERIVPLLRDYHLNVPVLLATEDAVAAAAEGILRPEDLSEVFALFWPSSNDFESRFLKRYGERPLLEEAMHYDTVYAVAKAFAMNPASPADAMRRVKFKGAGGEVDFGEGFAGSRAEAVLMKVRDWR